MRSARARLALTLLLAVACVEPAGPGDPRLGHLRLRATFAAGEDEGALRVSVDSIRVRITRDGSSAPLVDTATAFVRDDALGWVLDLLADREELDVRIELRGGAALLYAADDALMVDAGIVVDADVQDIVVSYVGAPRAMSVAVSPATASFTAIGTTRALAAVAYDRAGAVLPDVAFAWSSSAPDVATVDEGGVVTARAIGMATITAVGDGLAASSAVNVATSPSVTRSTIEAMPASIAADDIATSTITVRLFDGDGAPLGASGGPVELTTTLGNLTPVVDHADGTYTAALRGSVVGAAMVRATLGGVAIEDAVEVVFTAVGSPPVLTSIIVSPASHSFAMIGDARMFEAVARDEDGEPMPGVSFTWSSSDITVAAVDASTGEVTAVANGSATITATSGGVTGIAIVTVEVLPAPGRSTLAASPASLPGDGVSASALLVRLFDAGGSPLTTSGGRVELVSTLGTLSGVTDHGDGTYAATLRNAGVGTALVSGTLDGEALGNTVEVHFTEPPPRVLTSIDVSPAAVTLTAIGASTTLQATARDADGQVMEGVSITWTSGDAGVATVNASTGEVTAVASGTATITASAGAVTGTALVTIEVVPAPGLSTLAASPASVPADDASVSALLVRLFDAGGNPLTSSGGRVELVTSLGTLSAVTDQGDGTYTATIRSMDAGTAVVSGTLEGAALGNTVEIQFTEAPPRVLTSVQVAPAAITLTAIGSSTTLQATAFDADGRVMDGVSFTWSSGDEGIVTVNAATGEVTAVASGSATVIATSGGVSGTAVVTVEVQPAPGLSTLAASPSSVPADGVTTSALMVRLFDAGGSPLTRSGGRVELVSSFGALSEVTDRGDGTYSATIRSTVVGSAIVSGTLEGEALGNTIEVLFTEPPPRVLTFVEVSPSAVTFTAIGAGKTLQAIARDANGQVMDGVAFEWTSSDESVATVDPNSGLVTARAEGVATIRAQAGEVSGSATVTVAQRAASIVLAKLCPVEAVECEPIDALGNGLLVIATVRDSLGVLMPSATIAWGTSAPTIATVDGTGQVTATGNGVARITATSGEVIAEVEVVVRQRVTVVEIVPAELQLSVGASARLTATARDANGHVVADAVITWFSRNTDVVTVDETGLVTSVSPGVTSIKAFVGELYGEAPVRVE